MQNVYKLYSRIQYKLFYNLKKLLNSRRKNERRRVGEKEFVNVLHCTIERITKRHLIGP